MKQDRKQIIISEIQHWKENQVLPEQYCDFLLALYSQGEEPTEKESPYYLFFYFFNAILLFIPIILFATVQSIMVLAAGCAAALAVSFLFIRFFRRYEVLRETYAVMIFFLILALTCVLVMHYYSVSWQVVYGFVFVNSLAWILFGKWKQQYFLKWAGFLVLAALIIRLGFVYF
ncbi:hypothetical protein [Gracilibacillus alcaliphilus]|uniref:hypothetical protein n=1 Tax=Gracilibacillus alcaliphilus TaxID=1401441 RepID=UPI00195CC8EE|nr:hypothetical protein [Gracilibacillus alcaliphilus]MBM7675000.1 hypothetical protein [Gracilibacillus alcaliphilus]